MPDQRKLPGLGIPDRGVGKKELKNEGTPERSPSWLRIDNSLGDYST